MLVSNKKDDGSLKNDGTLTVTPKVAGRKAAGESDFTALTGNDAVLEFVNIYQAKGSARITGTKRVSGGPLREDFTLAFMRITREHQETDWILPLQLFRMKTVPMQRTVPESFRLLWTIQWMIWQLRTRAERLPLI